MKNASKLVLLLAQMMQDVRRLEAELDGLKSRLAEERSSLGPESGAEVLARRLASDRQLEAVETTVRLTRAQLGHAAKYLEWPRDED